MHGKQRACQIYKRGEKKGYDDYQIKEPLLKHGWPLDEIEKAFSVLKPRYKFKNKVSIYLESDILKILEKRGKKNMLNINEQIEDILRRSCLRAKTIKKQEAKIDDLLISIFSRRKYDK